MDSETKRKFEDIVIQKCRTKKGIELSKMMFLKMENDFHIDKEYDRKLPMLFDNKAKLEQLKQLEFFLYKTLLRFFDGDNYFRDRLPFFCDMNRLELEAFYHSFLENRRKDDKA